MKKIILLLAMAFGCISTYAQNRVDFQLTTNGTFVNSNGDDFVVLNYNSQKKEQLYSNTLVSITRLYTSPKSVISKVENEIISVNGYKKDFATYMMFANLELSVQYVFQIQFKDGKIRVTVPCITEMFIDGRKIDNPTEWIKEKIYKKGEVRKERIVTMKQMNSSINSIVNNILEDMENSKKDNW